MKVGWLADDPGYTGGAELTQAEFKAAAPRFVGDGFRPEFLEIVDCPPGEVVPGLDRYVIHNCVKYSLADVEAIGSAPTVKYVHDAWPSGKPEVRDWMLRNATLVFCSHLHQTKFRYPVPDWTVTKVIPPPIDANRFRPTRQVRRNDQREGTVAIAQWRNPGKGAHLLAEWARINGPVDVYGPGMFIPRGPDVNYLGAITPEEMPQVLWGYERFVFLPFDFEPFCRTVAEANFAGCKTVTNGLVGAREYLNAPGLIESAAEDFWNTVLA